jgi:predicted transcriptional regulator
VKERKDSSITVRLPQAMKETLESIAEAERRTLSQLVAVVLELYLETRDEWRAKARGRAVQRRSSTRRN